MEKQIKIPFNKSKLILFFIFNLVFFCIGIYFILYQPSFENIVRTKYTFIGKSLGSLIIGTLTILFFGMLIISYFKKLFIDDFSIIIDETRIIENTIGFSKKIILFEDIESTSIKIYEKNQFIFIYVFEPKKYIKNNKNIFDKFLMRLNYIFYKTPFMVNKNAVKFDFEKLHILIDSKILDFKKNYD